MTDEEILEALDGAEAIDAEVVKIDAAEIYKELRTREVEDGWVRSDELNEPYPYRAANGQVVALHLSDGRRLKVQDFAMHFVTLADGPNCVLLVHIEGRTFKAHAAEGCTFIRRNVEAQEFERE